MLTGGDEALAQPLLLADEVTPVWPALSREVALARRKLRLKRVAGRIRSENLEMWVDLSAAGGWHIVPEYERVLGLWQSLHLPEVGAGGLKSIVQDRGRESLGWHKVLARHRDDGAVRIVGSKIGKHHRLAAPHASFRHDIVREARCNL